MKNEEICNYYVMLFLDKVDEEMIQDFFTTTFYVPKNKVRKNLHLTLYHSRRSLKGKVNFNSSISLFCNISETRFMTMTPGGENPKSGVIPSKRSVGIRLTKRNECFDKIIDLRRKILQHEPKLGNRRQSTDRYNSFGARHFQPHINLLWPDNCLPNDLTEVGNKFRSELSRIKFSKLKTVEYKKNS